jgi:hypothetical protein
MTMPNRRLTCLMLLPFLAGPAFSAKGPMTDDLGDLEALSGEYGNGVQKVRLHADGRFTWEGTHLLAGGDAGIAVTASGWARFDANVLSLDIDKRSLVTVHGGPAPAGAEGMLPSRLHPARTPEVVVLLDEAAINQIANHVNAFGRMRVDVAAYLHRVLSGGPAGGGPLHADPDVLLPKAFAHRLLAAPLQGKVLAIDDITRKEVDMGGWMRPPAWRTQYSARMVIDLGASRGVFEGMRLYVGSVRQGVVVQRVLPDRCHARIAWSDLTPHVGDAVVSSMR